MFVGSFGVSFSNFPQKELKIKAHGPPSQQVMAKRLSLRARSNGSYYQNYSIAFEEPWLGGKKPNSFSIALLIYTILFQRVLR